MTARSTAPSPRKRGRPTESERIERRARILDRALPVFLEHGFGNATVEQLAQTAEVTKRTIYSYFGDKAGVFSEMVRSLATTVSDHAPDNETLEALSARIVYRLDSAELIGLHRLVIAESTRFPELATSLYHNGEAQHIKRLAAHIGREIGEGEAPAANELFALLMGAEHRKRLLGLLPPVTQEEARTHARRCLDVLGLVAVEPVPSV